MTSSDRTKTKKASSAGAQAKELAQQLLELHVAHELEALEPETFVAWLRPELELQLEQVKALSLEQFVTAEQVKQVIVRNVVENEIPGAVAELAGEGATRLFGSDMHKNTPLKKILSTKQFEDLVDKLLELPEQRKNGINRVIELPIYQDLISGVLYHAILRYIYEENVLSKNVPGVASMLKFGKRMIDKSAPKLEGAVEDNVRAYIASNLVFLLKESKAFLEDSLTEEDIKVSAMELWDVIEGKTMGEFQQGMDSIDLSEFVVIGYEFWKSFRKSKYFKNSYELIVDYFFEVYGSSPLSTLLDDFNITSDQIMQEVELFAPAVLSTLKESGQIEGFLRRRLEAFYLSKPALKCLKQ
jgi:hypothetical protein